MTTYSYKIELTDYSFIALELLLKRECKKLEDEHNIIAYDRESGETKHPLGVILKAMHESAANAQLNSFYFSG